MLSSINNVACNCAALLSVPTECCDIETQSLDSSVIKFSHIYVMRFIVVVAMAVGMAVNIVSVAVTG